MRTFYRRIYCLDHVRFREMDALSVVPRVPHSIVICAIFQEYSQNLHVRGKNSNSQYRGILPNALDVRTSDLKSVCY